MATHTIDDTVLHSAAAESYFVNANSRVMIGLRATVELLGLPTPEYAKRRKPGPTPAKAVANAFRADHPKQINTELPPRRDNASEARVAEVKALRA